MPSSPHKVIIIPPSVMQIYGRVPKQNPPIIEMPPIVITGRPPRGRPPLPPYKPPSRDPPVIYRPPIHQPPTHRPPQVLSPNTINTPKVGVNCPPYSRPPKITPIKPRLFKASEVIKRISLLDWTNDINFARREYARLGGKTTKPLTPKQVEAILTKAGNYKIVEDEQSWKPYMKELRTYGEKINDLGIEESCHANYGYAPSKPKDYTVLINPYITKDAVRWDTEVHEIEHVIKDLAGVPGNVKVKGWKTEQDTVHHMTKFDSKKLALFRKRQSAEPWYKQLFDYMFE